MRYHELLQLYFDRSNALQAYWTLYVVVLGGLLAFSSVNKQPSGLTTLLVSVLFCLFAYKNLDAIHDTTLNRYAALQALKDYLPSPEEAPALKAQRNLIEPTLNPATYSSVVSTHVSSDVLTVVTLWALELRRRRYAAKAAAI